MTEIKELLFEKPIEKVKDLDTTEIYTCTYNGERCLLVCGEKEVVRIQNDGKIYHATKSYYLTVTKELKKVTGKVRIIIDD